MNSSKIPTETEILSAYVEMLYAKICELTDKCNEQGWLIEQQRWAIVEVRASQSAAEDASAAAALRDAAVIKALARRIERLEALNEPTAGGTL
jgi:hypothetical protein